MSSPAGSIFDLASMLQSRGIDLASLGAAYVVLLATAALTAAAFVAARHYLIVAPNRWTRDYGIYVSLALATLLVAVVLENETLPPRTDPLHYVAMPQVLLLLGLHVAIWSRQEPWLVALGAAATAATVVVGVAIGSTTTLMRPAYWVTLAVLAALLGFLWHRAVSTQRGFMKATSIYVPSKETPNTAAAPQKPWLGLPQWVALAAASVALAIANALLRGTGVEDIPAVAVATESAALLGITTAICAVPALGYWLARKAWMPDLTRCVWLAWIVVGFAFTYGNYLNSLGRA